MSEQKKQFYEFGPFRIDVIKRRLFREGEVIRLTPKAFELLLVLVEEGGRTIEKDELLVEFGRVRRLRKTILIRTSPR